MTTPRFRAARQDVAQLMQTALVAADPQTAVHHHLHRNGRILSVGHFTYPLDQGNVYLISAGKAALPMAQATLDILSSLSSNQYPVISRELPKEMVPQKPDAGLQKPVITGLVIPKKTSSPSPFAPRSSSPSPLTLLPAAHPIPDESSVAAATAVKNLLQTTTANDLVLCLISGGTSALLTRPLIPLADWQTVSHLLLRSGCTIQEFNTVRRQLDEVKGGGLARWAAPAACLTLILSDVVGNPLPFIGSGPTVPGNDTPADALAVLQRYQVAEQLETAVWHTLQKQLQVAGTRFQVPTTPAPYHWIVGDVRQAAEAVVANATSLGFTAHLLTAQLEGEAREIGRFAAALAKDAPPNHCLVLGGESSVTVRGQGQGGRNQEIALAAAIALDGWPGRVVASFASDGEDGPTPAAGAWITGQTAEYGRSLGLDPLLSLSQNDSYTFFHTFTSPPATVGGLLQTGPTGTNVNDLLIILHYLE